jgi:hypothetical protein
VAEISKSEMLRHFAKELQSGNAALFVGAGLSKPSGFVDWKELMRDVASEIGLNVEKESDLIALAQYHVNSRSGGRNRLNRLLIEEFTKDSTLTENHQLIATLPVHTIWTTNYDELIETAFKQGHRHPDVKTTKENLATTLTNGDTVIYKMHGYCRQPQDAVLTKEDYETYAEKREVFSTALKGDLVERTFLFLGFSFTDPNIDYILSRIRGLLGQNQREHYCVMKWPDAPKDGTGAAQAEYEYQKRKLELRIADLSRYQIQTVMIKNYDEITEILSELNRRSHLKHIFVSGSAHDFSPLGKDRLERFCARLGHEIIKRGFTLVSGFGVGVGGAVVLGGLEQLYADGLPLNRVSLFPFPQHEPAGITKSAFRTQHRTSVLSNSGFVVFISGNRVGVKGKKVVDAPGVLEEFGIATKLGKLVIPFGASGWAAQAIWRQVAAHPSKYYGGSDLSAELKVLGKSGGTDDEYTDAIFRMLERLSR